MLHLVGDTDYQLIAYLGLRRVDGVGRELQHAFRLPAQRCDAEGGEIFLEMDDLKVLVEIDQIQGDEDAERMDSAGKAPTRCLRRP